MKNLHLVLMLATGSLALSAQSIDNLNLFNSTDLYGSPRYVAMGGAFTALGNDLSALHLNPAAGAVYRNNNFAFSLGFQNRQQQTDFLGNQQQFNEFSMMLGNIGMVTKFGPRDKFYFGVSYQQIANFDNNYSATGENIYYREGDIEGGLTLGEYWRDGALNYTADELAGMGYLEEASALNTVLLTDSNTGYAYPDYFADESSTLNYRVEESGGRNEFVLNLGGNFEDKFYYGAGIGFTNLNYRRSSQLIEYGYMDTVLPYPNVAESHLNRVNRLDASGINLKLGFIYRPVQAIRLGASIETPTWWYRVDEFQSVSVDALLTDNSLYAGTEYIADGISYSVQSPTIMRAGAAFVLGKIAIISADYEYQNTSQLTISQRDGFDYSGYQQDWKDATEDSHTLKGGIELRFGATYVRGGYQYRTSVYKDDYEFESSRQVVSAGIGYKSGPVGIDLGYSFASYTGETYVHPALAYGYDLANDQPLENYDVNRAIMPTEVKKGTLTVGMNFSF